MDNKLKNSTFLLEEERRNNTQQPTKINKNSVRISLPLSQLILCNSNQLPSLPISPTAIIRRKIQSLSTLGLLWNCSYRFQSPLFYIFCILIPNLPQSLPQIPATTLSASPPLFSHAAAALLSSHWHRRIPHDASSPSFPSPSSLHSAYGGVTLLSPPLRRHLSGPGGRRPSRSPPPQLQFGSQIKRIGKMRLVKVATYNLNQWAMDFDCNMKNIKESISRAKQAGAVIRLGPELEITGYGCEDHFLELDTVNHAWECLKELLVGDWTDGILCSFGMPVIKGSERYNCQVLCWNRKILMIRPKMWLANDGNYRELRWFTAWKQKGPFEDFLLPSDISEALSQTTVPFGYGYIQFLDVAIAAEVCEELFSPMPPHAELALNGVEVFLNASGSHHQLRKLDVRLRAFIGATHTRGGVYMYSNHQGCDGGRLYYDGCSSIVVNGDVVAQGSQFSLKDVEMVVAQIDLDAVASLRGSISSFQEQASCKPKVSSIHVPYRLCESFKLQMLLSSPLKIQYHSPEEEIAFGPGCWLWDYLRRSGASGFLLPLSGGADSSSVAAIVGCMCQLVVKAISEGDEQVRADAIRIGHYADGHFPTDSKEFAKRIFYTVFMGTENSSNATKTRAKVLAEEIGSWHLDVSIDVVISALLSLFQRLTGKQPRYKVDGGSNIENLGLQNIQARIRMVLAFMLASLLPWVHNKPGFYLVLGSSNVDEGLRGYLTKYDCSSADINPIGSISKHDLRRFLRWAAVHLGFSSLEDIEAAPPTAELEPIRSNYSQLDEVDMGMTYEELSVYGRMRKIFRCGPLSMFKNLCYKWGTKLSPAEVAEKVKYFFKYYSINRHKMTVLTPSYHAESYSPEDNRFDLRQFLYNARWPYQFRKMDELVKQLDGDRVTIMKRGDHEMAGVDGGMGVVAAGSSNPSVGL